VTKDEIIKIAQKVTGVSFPLGIDGISIGMNEKHLQDFANAIAATEREACANACNELHIFGEHQNLQIATIEDCVTAIRARGNNDV
jgi:hypothetical protein